MGALQVLLTSSDAVLDALPPALLAEARLLRERAMNQYQARGLFGGAHRIANRRNNVGIGAGGGSSTLDGGVGGTGLQSARRAGGPPVAGTRAKDVEGHALVETQALKAMLRLLRLAQV